MEFRIIVISSLALSLILSVYFVKTALDVYGNRSALFEAQQKLEEAKNLQDSYKKELNYRKTDEFVIKEAREKLNYGFEGEQIVIVPNEYASGGQEIQNEVNEQDTGAVPDKDLPEKQSVVIIEWFRVFVGAKGEI